MEWRGVVNAILYCVQFSGSLDDTEVERISRMILDRPFYDLTAKEQYRALTEALASGEELGGEIPHPHGEEEIRGFLRRMLERLDSLRPWPEPLFRRLDNRANWGRFRKGVTVARIHLGTPAQDSVVRLMEPLRDRPWRVLRVVILRLRSGDDLALTAPLARGGEPGVEAAMVLPVPHRDPSAVVAAFSQYTGFPRERVRLVGG